MADTLKSEFEYYLAHQAELVEKFDGRYVAIKAGHILGDYETELEAVVETQKEHPVGTFLVQLVSPGAAAYTQTFHTRVAFN